MIKRLMVLAFFVFSSTSLLAQSPVDGTWAFSMSSPMGAVEAQVVMKTDGTTLTGEFDLGGGRKLAIEEGSVAGSDIAFNITRDGASMTYVMKASVEGDSIKGTAVAMGSTIEWSMTR
jgi:hypothetical protein